MIDCYGARYGASALSANAFTRYVFAAAFPLFIIQSTFYYISLMWTLMEISD